MAAASIGLKVKLAFWPAVFWSFIEYGFFWRKAAGTGAGFILARASAAYIMPAVIVVIFYSYTAFTGDSILAVDLSSFVIAVVIGQVTGYRIWRTLRGSGTGTLAGITMLVVAALLFAVFTFWPPEAGIFRDSSTGYYGILPD